MKIQINDNESYEINLNDVVTLEELKTLVKKVELLSEPLSKPKPMMTIKTTTHNFNNDDKTIKCSNCGSTILYKKGFSRNGYRRMVCKDCGISFTIGKNDKEETKRLRRKPMKWNGRDDVIKALKIHYEGTKEEKLRFAKNKKTTWSNITKVIHNLRIKHDIKPKELGLKSFPILRGRPSRPKPYVNWK